MRRRTASPSWGGRRADPRGGEADGPPMLSLSGLKWEVGRPPLFVQKKPRRNFGVKKSENSGSENFFLKKIGQNISNFCLLQCEFKIFQNPPPPGSKGGLTRPVQHLYPAQNVLSTPGMEGLSTPHHHRMVWEFPFSPE